MKITPENTIKKALLVACLFLFQPIRAQNPLEYRELLFNGDFSGIERLYKEPAANDYWLKYYRAWALGLHSVLSGNELTYMENTRQLRQMIDEEEGTDARSLFLQQEYYLILSVTEVRFEQELAGVRDFRNAYRISRQLEREYPDFVPAQKSRGFINLLLGAVPPNFQWLLDLLGWEGNLQVGIDLMEAAGEEAVTGPEARMLLGLYRVYLLQDDQLARQALRNLLSEHNEPLVHLVFLTVMYKSGRAAEIINYYKQETPFAQAHFLMGEACLQSGRYNRAILAYRRYLSEYDGNDLVRDTHYKIFVAYYLQGEHELARQYLSRVTEAGESRVEADRYAVLQASREEISDPRLLKMRLATDGGFYTRAKTLAVELRRDSARLSHADVLELTYREARLRHRSGNPEEAMGLYLETIELQGQSREYYAPNSCLQLGVIYYEMGEMDTSEVYLKKAMRYPSHQYKRSIEQKARAMLSLMRRISQE